MANFTGLPYELKLQILGHLITPTQPVHLMQWRLGAPNPDIRFAVDDADVQTSLAFLLNSALDGIFPSFSKWEVWRMLVPRVRWLVTSFSKSDWQALFYGSNLTEVHYAPLLRKLETFFWVKVIHVVVVIDERSWAQEMKDSAISPFVWATLAIREVSPVLKACNNLKTLHVKLQVNMLPSYKALNIPAKFDLFYSLEPFHYIWENLAARYPSPDKPSDELYIIWKKICERKSVELKISARMVTPAEGHADEARATLDGSIEQSDRMVSPGMYEEDLTHFWDIPKCMRNKDANPVMNPRRSGLLWARQRHAAKRKGEQLPRRREHEATMGPDCEC